MAADGGMLETTTFTLDGKEVTAKLGESIWEVAKRVGTTIPHLCHADEPGYRSDGNCRACMVEIDGERVLAASCVRQPSEGMVVKSASDRAVKARKGVMELLVTDQPARDDAHDAASHFWNMADLCDVTDSRYPAIEQDRIPLLDGSHVAMRVNLDACIHCNLCVRACREVQVNDVIGMAGRGHDAKIVFDFHDPTGATWRFRRAVLTLRLWNRVYSIFSGVIWSPGKRKIFTWVQTVRQAMRMPGCRPSVTTVN